MKSFKELLVESHREYSYRIKFAIPVGSEEMDLIERFVRKYDLLEITNPIKTIMQKHPMDFSDIANAEIYIIDMTIGMPVSSYVLQQELKTLLNIPEKFIIVRKDNDPLELQTQGINAIHDMDEEAKEKGLVPASKLSTNSDYEEKDQTPEGDTLYGERYNSGFLNYLAQIRDKRVNNKVIAPQGYKESEADMYEEEFEDFNKDIDGAPKPVMKPTAGKTLDLTNVSQVGNYDEDSKKFYRTYRKRDSDKRVMMSKESDPIRRKRD